MKDYSCDRCGQLLTTNDSLYRFYWKSDEYYKTGSIGRGVTYEAELCVGCAALITNFVDKNIIQKRIKKEREKGE